MNKSFNQYTNLGFDIQDLTVVLLKIIQTVWDVKRCLLANSYQDSGGILYQVNGTTTTTAAAAAATMTQ